MHKSLLMRILKRILTRQEDLACGFCGSHWQASLVNKGVGGDCGQSDNIEKFINLTNRSLWYMDQGQTYDIVDTPPKDRRLWPAPEAFQEQEESPIFSPYFCLQKAQLL